MAGKDAGWNAHTPRALFDDAGDYLVRDAVGHHGLIAEGAEYRPCGVHRAMVGRRCGRITVIIKEGEGPYPLAPKNPEPVVDFIVKSVAAFDNK